MKNVEKQSANDESGTSYCQRRDPLWTQCLGGSGRAEANAGEDERGVARSQIGHGRSLGVLLVQASEVRMFEIVVVL